MMYSLTSFLLVFATDSVVGQCWSGDFTEDSCCYPTECGGNQKCWDGQYNFDLCCAGVLQNTTIAEQPSNVRIQTRPLILGEDLHFLQNNIYSGKAPTGFIQIFLDGKALTRVSIPEQGIWPGQHDPAWYLSWEFGYANIVLYLPTPIENHCLVYSYTPLRQNSCRALDSQNPAGNLPLRKRLFVDVDNTVAEAQPRITKFTVRLAHRYSIDNRAFSRQEMLLDRPLARDQALSALRILQDDGWCIEFLTARPWANALSVTNDWLIEHQFPFDSIIVTQKSQEKPIWLEEESHGPGSSKDRLILIDDLRRGYHEPQGPSFYKDTIAALEEKGIQHAVFDPNPTSAEAFWPAFVSAYIN